VSRQEKNSVYPRTASTVDGRVHIRFSCRTGECIYIKWVSAKEKKRKKREKKKKFGEVLSRIHIHRMDIDRPVTERKKEGEKIADCTLLLNGQTKQTEQAHAHVCVCV